MFLSRKMIVAIISVTGILFSILLIIQFLWIKRSVEVSQSQFENKMAMMADIVRKTFRTDKDLRTLLSTTDKPQDLYKNDNETKGVDTIVSHILDSIFRSHGIYMPCRVAGRIGNNCYIHNFTPSTPHNSKLDSSAYRICSCDNSKRFNLDIGVSFPEINKYLLKDNSWLIIPSFLLIILLITLFVFIIRVINRQKTLAELKNDFINNLTHEFNTPLFSIGLTSKMLLDSKEINSSARLRKYIELITSEKNRLQMQVDKMLQLTAIESGSLLMEKNPVDMHKLIEKNIAGFTGTIDDRNGSICYYPEAAHFKVRGDEVHLFNAVSCLLDNACKYSEEEPKITIRTSNTSRHLIISIEDNGIGISEPSLTMIFDKFFRERQGDRHDVKGFGIGLSYVKKIIELHKGSIQVKSKKGEGSTFIINLPFISN